MSRCRVIDGIKVGFVSSESYFQGMHSPSMHSTAKETGADIVLLLAEGVDESSLSDEELRALLAAIKTEVEAAP